MKALLVFLMFLISTSSYAGPFGLEMGMPLIDLSKQMDLKILDSVRFTYGSVTVPKMYPGFKNYMLTISPKHGLCAVGGRTDSIATSVYGTELLSKFDELEKLLTSKYGVFGDSQKKGRTLDTIWNGALPDNLAAIWLSGYFEDRANAKIILLYKFKNVEECNSLIKASAASAL